jgi:long-chain fatty acid transport protein
MKRIQRSAFNISLFTVLGLAMGLISQAAWAGGPQLFEQTAAGLGTAQAGYAAAADDASTEYSNPAGMVRIKHPQVSTGAELIALNINYQGSTATEVKIPPAKIDAIIGLKQGIATSSILKPIPNFHFVTPINDRWYVGTGVTVPFGLVTNYADDGIAAQYATLSSMQTINVSEDLAYAANDKFSIGAGIDIQRFNGEFDADLFNHISVINKVNDVGLGAHAGVLFQFTPTTRVGLAYHSEIDHHSQGLGTVNSHGLPSIVIPGVPLPDGIHDSGTVTMDLPLPAWLSFGVYHDMNEKWAVMSTLQYTYWNVVKSLTIQGIPVASFAGSGVEISDKITLPMNFRNSYVLDLGTTYKFSPKFMGRFGLGYDETPTVNAYRELRLPDSNKFNVAMGAHFQPTQTLGLDLGYEHVFAQAANVDKSSPLTDVGKKEQLEINQLIKGVFNNSVDVIGAQLTYDF